MGEKVDKTSETFLVLRCQSGDREAFDLLFRSIQAGLWRYISNLAGEPGLADDVLQDVFLIIYRKIGWLNDPDLLRPWVYRIATRETFRVLKKRSRWREEPFDETTIATLAAPEVGVDLDVKVLESVSPSSRAVLMLHYLEDLSLKETAEVLDISLGTVKSRLAYGLKTLRLRQDGNQIDVVVYDVCSDSDCDGCCTSDAAATGFLIDIESYTAERFGSGDGIVEWACLDCD